MVDPGIDLEPMTFDDMRRGQDGIIHTADDVGALESIAEPGEGQGGEHQDHATEAGEPGQHGVGDVEGVLDVGPEHLDRHLIGRLEDQQQRQEQDHGHPALAQRLARAHRLTVQAREQVVGEQELFGPVGLLAFLLLLHDLVGQGRGTARRVGPWWRVGLFHEHSPCVRLGV